MLTYNKPEPMMPQGNTYDYQTMSPEMAQLIMTLANFKGSPMMMAGNQSHINPINRTRFINEQISEAPAPVPVAQPQPQVRYVKPSRVKRSAATGGVIKWDDYNQAWMPMSNEEVSKYINAGGVIGE